MMIASKFFQFLIPNLFILLSKSLIETVLLSNEQNSIMLIEGDTSGVCQKQLNLNPQDRNCRYGRCELIKSGTDFACHCDNFVTGKKCDRLVIDKNDVCASNPCWGESLCILVENSNTYRCLCPESRTGTFCQFEKSMAKQNQSQNNSESNLTNILTSTKTKYLINLTKSIFLSTNKSNSSLGELNQNLNSIFYEKNNSEILEVKSFTSDQKSNLLDLLESKSNTCNLDNCQFGKCLNNGTCECTRPAFGKYCDQIDECLVLTCKNGECKRNKGCVCSKGFQGVLCDIPILTTNFPEINPQNKVNKTITLLTKSSTKLNSLLKQNHFSTLSTSSKNTSILNEPNTTTSITNCENGGLLIDNMCLCLNQFTGIRCEKPPTFTDALVNTKTPELESIELMSTTSASKDLSIKTTEIEIEEFIPIISLSRFNAKTKKVTSRMNIYWPWLECFPGDSKIYSKSKINGKIEQKLVSQLEIGDEVLAVNDFDKLNFSQSELKFSRIVSFLHQIRNIDATFIRLHYVYNSNKTGYITLTPKHLIYAKRMDRPEFEFMAAFQVLVGDYLKKYDWEEKLNQNVHVTKIEKIVLNRSGIFAPLTESGTIIVDNILTSCYSMVRYHGIAHFFFNLLNRLNYYIELTSNAYVSYSKFLYEILNFLHLKDIFMNENIIF